jgi:hypothetical protein
MLQKKLPDGAIVSIQLQSTSWAQDDARWFRRRPHRSHRVRPRLPGEFFVEENDAPDLDWVGIWQSRPGLRIRAPFTIPADSPCAEYVRAAAEKEYGAAILFDLTLRGGGGGEVRCDVLMMMLDQQGGPGGRVR